MIGERQQERVEGLDLGQLFAEIVQKHGKEGENQLVGLENASNSNGVCDFAQAGLPSQIHQYQ